MLKKSLFACILFSSVSFGDGLPIFGQNEWDLYARHPDTKMFSLVWPGSEKKELLYVRWSVKYNLWLWVSGHDRRIILSGSKVQGWRLGLPERRGLNWFRLTQPGTEWVKVTDRRRPEIYREDEFGNVVRSEQAPEEWVTWGGDLDPLPTPAPTCRLKANPNPVVAGKALTLSLEPQGEVSSAQIDGSRVSPPLFERMIMPDKKGSFTARATVQGPGGSGTCETTYEVLPPTPLPAAPVCALSAIPDSIRLGETLRLVLRTYGEVTDATLEGASIAFPLGTRILTPSTTGTFNAVAQVRGPGGQSSCETRYEVR